MAETSTFVGDYQQLLRCLLRSTKRLLLMATLVSLGILFRVIQDYTNPAGLFDANEEQSIYSNFSTQNPYASRILVAFAGPSSPGSKKVNLFKRNTDHFLKYGVRCHDRDTIITVGEEYYDDYYPKVKAIRDSQCSNGHFVHLISRRSFCYDMETVRLIVRGAVAGVNWREYDYFVYIDSSVSGPHPELKDSWLQIYLSKLKSPVHMTGLSLNCDPDSYAYVQSMVFAIDRVAMDLIQSIPYDCTVRDDDEMPDSISKLIAKYEVGMSRRLLENGHAIAPVTLQMGGVVTKDTNCNFTDVWYPDVLSKMHGGQLPKWKETIFWTSSRFMTREIQKVIGYRGKIDFTS